jgi:glucose-1-phosphate adenylyltransferase
MRKTLGIIINNHSNNLMPLTGHRNPITLPFFSRYRLIDFAMSNMVNSNINKIGIVASDKYRSLLDHVGTGQEWGLSRKSQSLVVLQGTRQLNQSDVPQVNLMDFEKNRMVFERSSYTNVILAAPDVVCHIDYSKVLDVHDAMGGDVTMVCQDIIEGEIEEDNLYLKVDDEGTVTKLQYNQCDGCNKKLASKMILTKETMLKVLNVAGEIGEYELVNLIKENLDYFKVKCYTFHGYMRKIKTIDDYYNTSMELLDINTSCNLFSAGTDDIIYTKIKDNHPTLYKKTSSVKRAAVASGSTIAGKVENTILFRNIKQQENSVITNSILMEGCKIGKNVVLDYVIADRNVVISDNIVIKGTRQTPVVLQKETIL